jgi:signal transduction histidine kinase
VTINEMLRARYVAWVGGRIQMRAAQLNYETMVQNEADIERAVDQLHDLDRLKSNFLGLVSHELRTPLTSIIGFAEMLTEGVAGPLNEKQQSHAETVLARAEQLQKLVSRVIEAAELEFEPVHLDLHALSLRQIVDRAWNELKYDAARAGKSLRNDVPADLEGLIDGGKLLIVVTNLLDNAIKFSVGDKHIAVNAERAPLRRSLAEADPFGEEEAAAILVTIRNQTQGLAPDQLKKIFEIFRQGDLQLTRAQGGLGLGLAVADRIVRAHGGEIWAELSGESDLAVRFTIPPGNAV